MVAYANLHLVFEQMRIRARRAERGATPELEETMEDAGYEPPRVLVIGPEHSGKTTACKILATYAVRGISACTPLYINLDPNEVRTFSGLRIGRNLRGHRIVRGVVTHCLTNVCRAVSQYQAHCPLVPLIRQFQHPRLLILSE